MKDLRTNAKTAPGAPGEAGVILRAGLPRSQRKGVKMDYDTDKVDDMALALLYLTHFREKKEYPYHAWKGMDWDVLNRVHEKGWIGEAKNKNKSIVFTDEGFHRSEQLFQQHFGIRGQES